MTLRRLIVIAVLAGLVAACGARGALEPPPGTADDQQKKDPDFVLDRIL